MTIDFSDNPKKSELRRKLDENLNFRLKEAHNRVQEERREQQRRRPARRRTGSVRLSNTDSVGRARRVRAQLVSKLQEVYGSDASDRNRGAMAMDIKLQIQRVDQQIAAIRRRERAMEEERTTRRENDTPEARRRRIRDMQERRINIRRDLLYPAASGGFDPNNPLGKNTSVVCDIGGNVAAPDVAPDLSSAPDFSMDFAL
ncbi:MAG: hypothetical protein FWC70_10245 [Defluviitaleaceae bacterium]|nr:hypothetical protein [Defluviitaleaceae bacterium]